MHDKFLLLRGSRDAFFNTILADHIIVLIAFAHITCIFHAHTGLHMAFFVFQTFGQNSQAVLAIILLTIGTSHVLV